MDANYGEQLIHVSPPKTPSVLWNSMMYPFTNMTIYGAIWYQGEANAGIGCTSHHAELYFFEIHNSIAEANYCTNALCVSLSFNVQGIVLNSIPAHSLP